MKEIISKELYEEIRAWWVFSKYQDKEENLHRDIQADIREQWDGNDYCSGFSDNDLANICKEWATRKGYQFNIYIFCDGMEEVNVGKCGYGWDICHKNSMIEACQWILDNKDK
jgi:hypothetical protein